MSSHIAPPRPASKGDAKAPTSVEILKDFLREMASTQPDIPSTNEELEALMRREMNKRNIACPELENILHLSASLSEMGYHKCTFAEKTTLALFNWYMIYIDDMCSKDVATYSVFQERFLRGVPQLSPILDALADVLLRFFDQYNAPTANSILSAAFDFINSTCIEPKLETIPPVLGAVRFPWYFRDRAGMAIVYALMLFPKSRGANVSDYIQVLQDMNFWISATNDVLSFHKEELAGETNNYIHNRSRAEAKAPLKVFAEVVQELHESRRTIYAGLAHNQQAIDMWISFEQGYIGWHLIQKRYKLAALHL